MRRFILLVLTFFTIQYASAQISSNTVKEDNDLYTKVEVSPSFPGGMKHFYSYLVENFNESNIDKAGEILVQLVIEKDGKLSDIKVLKDLGKRSGKEIVRLLKKGPNWIPGEQNGKKVRVLHLLPIRI